VLVETKSPTAMDRVLWIGIAILWPFDHRMGDERNLVRAVRFRLGTIEIGGGVLGIDTQLGPAYGWRCGRSRQFLVAAGLDWR